MPDVAGGGWAAAADEGLGASNACFGAVLVARRGVTGFGATVAGAGAAIGFVAALGGLTIRYVQDAPYTIAVREHPSRTLPLEAPGRLDHLPQSV